VDAVVEGALDTARLKRMGKDGARVLMERVHSGGVRRAVDHDFTKREDRLRLRR
jgi:hypothetical protein